MLASLSNRIVFLLAILSFVKAEKLIIDTDVGGDDAVGILMLLRAETLRESPYEIVAITCSYGNTKEENVENNVIRILSFVNRTDIPVYGGSKRSLLLGQFPNESIYGKDGFGDSKILPKSKNKNIEPKHASLAMIELSKKHEGNISIVVLGPTTNVALAISLDGKFISRVKKFFVMGSSVSGIGNLRANVEYNFGADPESNFILLSSTNSSQLTLFPWETTWETELPTDWRVNILGKKKSPYVNFINQIERISLKVIGKTYENADSQTVATMLWPQIIKSSIKTYVQAVTDGTARGSVLVDYLPLINPVNKPPNAKIIKKIDVKLYQRALIYYLTCEIRAC